jgi:hypothetical protein
MGIVGGGRKARKRFFFEKKKQKTFTPCGAAPAGMFRPAAFTNTRVKVKSFLVLFFKKELLVFTCF